MEQKTTGAAQVRAAVVLHPALESVANRVIGAAIEVHRALGPGHLESVYEEALCVELGLLGIAFERQAQVEIRYKNQSVGQGKIDILVEKQLVVELKAVDEFSPIHTAQVISYLKMTHLRLGLLINFNVPMLKEGIRRIIL